MTVNDMSIPYMQVQMVLHITRRMICVEFQGGFGDIQYEVFPIGAATVYSKETQMCNSKVLHLRVLSRVIPNIGKDVT